MILKVSLDFCYKTSRNARIRCHGFLCSNIKQQQHFYWPKELLNVIYIWQGDSLGPEWLGIISSVCEPKLACFNYNQISYKLHICKIYCNYIVLPYREIKMPIFITKKGWHFDLTTRRIGSEYKLSILPLSRPLPSEPPIWQRRRKKPRVRKQPLKGALKSKRQCRK